MIQVIPRQSGPNSILGGISRINIAEISDKTVTLYIGVEKLSKKDNHTEFTLLIANEFDRFYTASENAELFDKAKNFVNGFAEPVAAADLEIKIAAQQEVFAKNEKKLHKLKEDGADFEKQKKKIEEKIANNIKETETVSQESAKIKEALDALIKQRKN